MWPMDESHSEQRKCNDFYVSLRTKHLYSDVVKRDVMTTVQQTFQMSIKCFYTFVSV